MTDHLTKAKEYRDLVRITVERAQAEADDRAQSSLYAIAESYLALAELELKAAAQDPTQQHRHHRSHNPKRLIPARVEDEPHKPQALTKQQTPIGAG